MNILLLIAGILLVVSGVVIGWATLTISKLRKEVFELQTPF